MKFLSLIIFSCILLLGAIAAKIWLDQQSDSTPLQSEDAQMPLAAPQMQNEQTLPPTNPPTGEAMPSPPVIDRSEPEIAVVTVEPVMAPSIEDEPPRPDPIEWIQQNWKGALRTITITDTVEVSIIIDGENVGSAWISENTKLPIQSIDSETISVKYMQGIHELPHASTNIRELAERGVNFTMSRAARPQEASHAPSGITDSRFSSSGVSDGKADGRFPQKFPLFSWDKVPVYKMFGDGNGLTDEQARFIAATTDFVSFEKHHGSKRYQTVEKGTKHDIAKLRAENPKIKALMYFNASILWPNGSSVRALFDTEEEHNYYRAPLKQEFEEWAMKRKDGSPYTRGDTRFKQFFMNISHPEYQQWWIESAVNGVNYTDADGIYIDAFWIPTFLMKYNDLTEDDSNRARKFILDALKSKLGSDKMIFINQGNAKGVLLDGGEGFMFENYKPEACTPEAIIKDWKQMKLFHDTGKLSVWRIGVNNTGDTKDENSGWEQRSKELATFWTAAFLIGAQEYSYFQYGWGFQLLKGGSLVDYPEFNKRLGEPLGDYVQKSEFEFTRSFKYADVWVDLQNHKANIDWK